MARTTSAVARAIEPQLNRILLRLGFSGPRERIAAARAYTSLRELIGELQAAGTTPDDVRVHLQRLEAEICEARLTMDDEPTVTVPILDPLEPSRDEVTPTKTSVDPRYVVRAEFEQAVDDLAVATATAADTSAEHRALSRVMRAFDTQLEREIALRELCASSNPGKDAYHRTQFLREAKITGTLDHPTVAPVYEIGTRPNGRPYCAMKLVRGRSLSSAIRTCRTLVDRLALVRHFEDLCEGLAYAHKHGVVHRNLRSDDIMLGEFGETIALGWGHALVREGSLSAADAYDRAASAISGRPTRANSSLADLQSADLHSADQHSVDQHSADQHSASPLSIEPSGADSRPSLPASTETNAAIHDAFSPRRAPKTPLGTPASMSPEHARGDARALDERSDVFSLGAILFEILCGHSPHAGKDIQDVVGQAARRHIPPVRVINRRAPPALAAICDRALRFSPDDRYQDAAEMLVDVRAFTQRQIQASASTGVVDRARRFARRHRLALSILAGVLGLTTALVLHRDHNLRATRNAAVREEARVSQTLSVMLSDRAAQTDSPHQAMLYAGAALLYTDQPEARGTIARVALEPRPRMVWQSHPGAKCRSIAFTDNGKLSCADELDGWFQWDVRTGGEIAGALRNSEAITKEVVSRDGLWRATSDTSGTVRVFSFDDEPARAYGGFGDEIVALDVASDDTGSAIVGALNRQGSLRVFGENSVPEGETIATCKGARAFALGPRGNRFALGCPEAIEIRDTAPDASDKPIQVAFKRATAIGFSGDGQSIVAGNSRGAVIAMRVSSTDAPRTLDTFTTTITAVSASSDGESYGIGGLDGTIATGSATDGGRARRIAAHRGPVWSVSLSPRADIIASSGPDGTVRLFKTRDGTKDRAIISDSRWIYDVGLTPDGRSVVACNTDGAWSVRAADDGTLSLYVPSDSNQVGRELTKLSIAPDGQTLVTGDSAGRLKQWSLATGKKLGEWQAHRSAVWALRHLDNDRIVSGSASGEIVMWTHGRAEILVSARERRPASIATTPDGRYLVYTDGDNVRVEEMGTTTSFSLPVPAERVTSIAIAPDGATLAIAENKRIALWDVVNRKLLRTLNAHTDIVHDVEFSPTGEDLASASFDRTARLWRVADGHLIATIDHGDHVRAVSFSPSGDRLITGGWDRSLRAFDVKLGVSPVFRGHSQPVKAVTFNDDGTELISVARDGSIRRWDIDAGREISKKQLEGEQVMTLSRDGLRLVTSDRHGVAYLWDLERGTKRTLAGGQSQTIATAAFSPNGAILASLGHKGELLAWSVSDHTMSRLNRRAAAGRALAVASSGLIATADMMQATVELWETDHPARQHDLSGHSNWVTTVAISPEADTVASAGYDGTVHLWRANDGQTRIVIPTPQKTVTHLVFSPAADQIAAGGTDGTLRIFDVATGRELATLRGYSGGQPAYAPDGQSIAAAVENNGIRRWALSVLERSPQDILEMASKESGLRLLGARLSPDPDGLKSYLQ